MLVKGATGEIYYNDVMLTSWHLKSPAARLYVQQIGQAENKENIKAPHYWHFVRNPPVTSSYGGHGGSFQSYIHMKIHVNCRFPNEVKKILHKKFLYNTTKTQKSLWSFDGNFSVMCVKFHVKLHRKLLNLWKFNFISKSIFHVKFQIE